MLPTPSTSHVSFDNVYEPAEDSYLLLDTLSLASETAFLTARFEPPHLPPLILEVGTGSGVVLAFIAANASILLGRSDVPLLGTDINILAARAAHGTAQRALSDAASDRHDRAGFLDTLATDLAGPIKRHAVDMLIFNPPYVPTESLPDHVEPVEDALMTADDTFQRDSKLLELSYAGGADGMETTNRLLEQLPDILSDDGVAYILLSAQNKPEKVKTWIKNWNGHWSAEIVGSSGKKAGWEKLCILRIWRGHGHPT